jgi:hypothetical protein
MRCREKGERAMGYKARKGEQKITDTDGGRAGMGQHEVATERRI